MPVPRPTRPPAPFAPPFCPAPQELLRANVLKGAREVLRSSRLIGRASVPLAAAAAEPFARRRARRAGRAAGARLPGLGGRSPTQPRAALCFAALRRRSLLLQLIMKT